MNRILKNFTLIFLLATVILVTSCTKDGTLAFIKDLEGTYDGVLVYKLNSQTDSLEAIAEVTQYSATQISFHCYSSVFDTTMILDAFENGDSLNVCLTGDAFYNRYGHHQGERPMRHMGRNTNAWQHHLDDEHDAGDQHFGALNHSDGHCYFEFLDVNGTNYTFYGTIK